MVKMYYDQDADLQLLAGKTVAIIGYGSQGHAHAQNLRDSGVKVVVAELPTGPNADQARADGFTPVSAAEAAQQADIIMILLADNVQPLVYRQELAPHLKPGATLMFAHGFNIHFNQIVPPPEINVAMVAPKGPGHLVRRTYTEGSGTPSLIAIHQDASGQTRQVALAYAKGLGATRAGVIETTFAEETETDLFGEQVILCGGVSALIKASFETLVEAGYAPEMAYFECCHELKLIVDLIYEGGLEGMRYSVSDTAEYGDYTRGPRIVTEQTKAEMRTILGEIQNGQFAREWIVENQAGRPSYNALKRKDTTHPLEVVGRQLRSMMSWLKKKAK